MSEQRDECDWQRENEAGTRGTSIHYPCNHGRRASRATVACILTVVAADEAVAVLVRQHAVDVLFRLFQRDVHEAIQANENACSEFIEAGSAIEHALQ